MKKMFTVALLFLFIIGITDIAIAQSTDQSDTDNSGNIRDKISKDAIEKRGKQLLKTANNRLNIIEKLDREEKKINNIENKLQKKEKEIEFLNFLCGGASRSARIFLTSKPSG